MDRCKGFIEALKNGKGYDFIANHYYEFTKEELKDIALELAYGIYKNMPASEVLEIAEELEERWEFKCENF